MYKILEKEFKDYHSIRNDIEEVKQLYRIYEGPGQTWNTEDLAYFPIKKISNYIKKLIKEEARFMFSKTPTFNILDVNGDNQEEIQKSFDNLLRENLFQAKLIKGARDCFIGKRVAIKVNIIDKKAIITFVPSTNFAFEVMENRTDKLKKVMFFQKTVSTSNKVDERIWVQKYEVLEGKCFLTETIVNGNYDLVETIFQDKNINMDEIPCYVLINDGLSHDFIGESDVKEILDNGLIYNRIASEDLDTLRKGMNRIIYAIDVDEDSSKQFELKPGAFWDVASDSSSEDNQASLGTINTDFGYDSRMENALKRIKNDMYEALNIPQVSNEDLKGLMTSGKSMKALYWQLITRCEEKFIVWNPALRWLATFLLKYSLQVKEAVNVEIKNNYPLQEDEDNQKSIDMQQVNSDLMSRKSYMTKWRGLKEDAIKDELGQIQLEKQMLEDSFSQFEPSGYSE